MGAIIHYDDLCLQRNLLKATTIPSLRCRHLEFQKRGFSLFATTEENWSIHPYLPVADINGLIITNLQRSSEEPLTSVKKSQSELSSKGSCLSGALQSRAQDFEKRTAGSIFKDMSTDSRLRFISQHIRASRARCQLFFSGNGSCASLLGFFGQFCGTILQFFDRRELFL